jgi:hypothetical protein
MGCASAAACPLSVHARSIVRVKCVCVFVRARVCVCVCLHARVRVCLADFVSVVGREHDVRVAEHAERVELAHDGGHQVVHLAINATARSL